MYKIVVPQKYDSRNKLMPSSELLVKQSKNSLHFMKAEGSIPLIQQPAKCSYPEPDNPSPHPPV